MTHRNLNQKDTISTGEVEDIARSIKNIDFFTETGTVKSILESNIDGTIQPCGDDSKYVVTLNSTQEIKIKLEVQAESDPERFNTVTHDVKVIGVEREVCSACGGIECNREIKIVVQHPEIITTCGDTG